MHLHIHLEQVLDNDVFWTYEGTRTDGNLFQNGWASITGGSNYLNGTYLNVPLTTNGDGKDAKADIVISGNSVTSVTITDFGYGYDIGDTISADNLNLGNNGGAGFTITLTQVVRQIELHCDLPHQLKVGDLVNVAGVSPVSYNKANYIVSEVIDLLIDSLLRGTLQQLLQQMLQQVIVEVLQKFILMNQT